MKKLSESDLEQLKSKLDGVFQRLEERRKKDPEGVRREHEESLKSLPDYPEPGVTEAQMGRRREK